MGCLQLEFLIRRRPMGGIGGPEIAWSVVSGPTRAGTSDSGSIDIVSAISAASSYGSSPSLWAGAQQVPPTLWPCPIL